MSYDTEETIVGVHASGVQLEEGLNVSLSRNYCSNCKKKIHNYVKVNRKTKEAVIHNTCKSPDCECKCKTHFACKHCGKLHPYGQKYNNQERKVKYNQDDEEFNKILEDWRQLGENKS